MPRFEHTHSVYPIYAVLILIGVVRAFNGPVSRALLPQLVPEEHFPNAVAWASGVFQTATILGPSIGGVVYAAFRGPAAVYALAMVSSLVATVCAYRIKVEARAQTRSREPISTSTVLAGFHYIWRQKLILGSISLDLFAVLLGGAVALLPVYASEILRTGPWGLGILRSAPGVGAAAMAIYLAYRPLRGKVGLKMLACVSGVWRLHDTFRHFAQLDAVDSRAGACRRDRHGQRDRARHADSDCDAGRDARARERRGYGFHWGFERVGAV